MLHMPAGDTREKAQNPRAIASNRKPDTGVPLSTAFLTRFPGIAGSAAAVPARLPPAHKSFQKPLHFLRPPQTHAPEGTATSRPVHLAGLLPCTLATISSVTERGASS